MKDEILGCYLVPYLTKMQATGRPVIIADCFAGKGRFDDGKPGSPIIIADTIKGVHENNPSAKVECVFIENKYFAELEKNIAAYPNCKALDGRYEDRVENFLEIVKDTNKNLFLYVDPYGIKSLDFKYFRRISEKGFSSLEVLMNFNSFGFLREGCRLLGLKDFNVEDSTSEEYEKDDANTIERMNAIAAGVSWQDILKKYHEDKFSMYEAEQQFAEQYTQALKTLFCYVANIPVKRKRAHVPKYRLFYGTSYPDGLILMTDKMSRVWSDFIKNEGHGQLSLDECFDFPDMTQFGGYNLQDDILALAADGIGLKDMIVQLMEKYGITFPEKRYKDECRNLEKDGQLVVIRNPAFTPTGKPATAMDYKKYNIVIKAD